MLVLHFYLLNVKFYNVAFSFFLIWQVIYFPDDGKMSESNSSENLFHASLCLPVYAWSPEPFIIGLETDNSFKRPQKTPVRQKCSDHIQDVQSNGLTLLTRNPPSLPIPSPQQVALPSRGLSVKWEQNESVSRVSSRQSNSLRILLWKHPEIAIQLLEGN